VSGGSVRRALRQALLATALVACERPGDDRAPAGDSAGARTAAGRALPDTRDRYGIGRVATAAEVAAWDIDANPAGVGLPPGRGTHAEGAPIYAAKCASCHGPRGEGMGSGAAAYPKLVGREPRDGFPFGKDRKHVKTVGNYWPYATTVYDYIHRAMPLTAPGSLTPHEVYSLTAFLLAENEVIARDAVIDATTLRAVRMPARDRFVRDDRTGGPTFR